jgi:hypothetical protein
VQIEIRLNFRWIANQAISRKAANRDKRDQLLAVHGSTMRNIVGRNMVYCGAMDARSKILGAAIFCACVASTTGARAETTWAPVNGRAVPVGKNRIVCPAPAPTHGWTIDAGGTSVTPPSSASEIGEASTLTVAANAAACASSNETIDFVAVGPAPQVDRTSAAFDSDAGVVTLHGHALKGVVLAWTIGTQSGSDVCGDPQVTGADETCAFALPKSLSTDAASISLRVLPRGARADGAGFDLLAHPVNLEGFHPARFVIRKLAKDEAAIDLQSSEAHLPLAHADAIASVDCADARCAVEGSDLVVRDLRSTADAIDAKLTLRPHFTYAHGAASDVTATLSIALRRCPVSIASAPPLRGVRGQRLVVKVGGACANDPSLAVTTGGSRVMPERDVASSGARYLIVPLDSAFTDEIAITVQRGNATLGAARIATRAAIDSRARLELPGIGAIDFVPTNRDARVWSTPLDRGILVPISIDGAYSVKPASDGTWLLRGASESAGTIAIKFAYRDPTLPAELRNLDLAVVEEPTAHPERVANIPVSIGASAAEKNPLVELVCGNEKMVVGETTSIPFSARDSCRLILHRERLRPEDGTQIVQVVMKILQSDGTPKNDVSVDQRVTMRPGEFPRILYIAGVGDPFDRAIVRVSVVNDDLHYAIIADERVKAPQAQWAVVFGTSHFRVFATTAIPTGLFRVADHAHSGLLSLNAGALFRLVPLSKEGREFPIGAEAGAMWLGIVGDETDSPHGQAALVAGLGISVPIANPSRATQTSINLHVWGEYEASRALSPSTSGTPWGLIFGPSLSIGDVGTNF